MKLSDFDYELPLEAVAQEPLPQRDASRLLVLPRDGGTPHHHVFRDLPYLLRPGDLLVVNRSQVFPARLLGRRATGGRAEVLLISREGSDLWDALVQPGRRLRSGDVVRVDDGLEVDIASEARPPEGRRRVRLRAADGNVDAALGRAGHVPLPPYIRRPDRPEDRERYQTIFARESGSIAAPTAGLHFSPDLLAALGARGIRRADVVLHVGPGTFKPVTVDDVRRHTVEAEPFVVPPETAEAVARTRAQGGRVVAVGTTTVRTLETVARENGTVEAREGRTDLVIVPGHRFRAVDALVTNFHLPRSSLLLLVAAFAGRERVLAAYEEAIRAGYRFYSYGDAMLVE
ncbi:MAG: tRNA preQ1(34) S-adenosylmethionine ribosyltransferase-isomerase QueA [Acidobacteria bacterium]|nr:tRNA preQ1(34) S-adenosylmethionine ribosyltransferase-isomerase QueA [Acidobacteriota bacterium]